MRPISLMSRSLTCCAAIEDLRVAATTRTYDNAVAVPVYRPFRLVSFLSNGAYSKTLNMSCVTLWTRDARHWRSNIGGNSKWNDTRTNRS